MGEGACKAESGQAIREDPTGAVEGPCDGRSSAGIAQADLLTEHLLAEMATKKDLAKLEARLAWRLITAGIAIAEIAVAAVVALLRLVG